MFGNFFGGGNNGGQSGGGIAHGAAGPVAVPLTPAAGTQQPTAQGNGNPAANNSDTGQPAAAGKESSPLDKLQAFWQNTVDADGKPVAQAADPTAQTIYNFDPTKVSASAKTLDFTAGIDPALATKALQGDAAALMDLVNGAIQNSFAAMTLQTGKLINDGVSINNTRVKEVLPKHIRAVQVDQATATNPVLSHPAMQPLFATLKSYAASKNPNASPTEITQQVEGLLSGMAEAMQAASPAAQAAAKTAAAGESDWTKFIEGN